MGRTLLIAVMGGLNPMYYAFSVPFILVLVFMLMNKDLHFTAVVLMACLAFTSVMMYLIYTMGKMNLEEGKAAGPSDGIDRSMFKVIKLRLYGPFQ